MPVSVKLPGSPVSDFPLLRQRVSHSLAIRHTPYAIRYTIQYTYARSTLATKSERLSKGPVRLRPFSPPGRHTEQSSFPRHGVSCVSRSGTYEPKKPKPQPSQTSTKPASPSQPASLAQPSPSTATRHPPPAPACSPTKGLQLPCCGNGRLRISLHPPCSPLSLLS